VLLLAPRIPTTRPRWRTNQRVATVGPRTLATSPVPSPDRKPNARVSCQISRTTLVMTRDAAVSARLTSTTLRTPIRLISHALSGPASPNTTSPTAAANETEPVDQPGSFVIVRMNAPGADRTPAVIRTTPTVTATTTQP
jgi:hypothetical protein